MYFPVSKELSELFEEVTLDLERLDLRLFTFSRVSPGGEKMEMSSPVGEGVLLGDRKVSQLSFGFLSRLERVFLLSDD